MTTLKSQILVNAELDCYSISDSEIRHGAVIFPTQRCGKISGMYFLNFLDGFTPRDLAGPWPMAIGGRSHTTWKWEKWGACWQHKPSLVGLWILVDYGLTNCGEEQTNNLRKTTTNIIGDPTKAKKSLGRRNQQPPTQPPPTCDPTTTHLPTHPPTQPPPQRCQPAIDSASPWLWLLPTWRCWDNDSINFCRKAGMCFGCQRVGH